MALLAAAIAAAAQDDGWKTSSPDSLGVDSRRLAALTEAVLSTASTSAGASRSAGCR
jgi:hypothetical protein